VESNLIDFGPAKEEKKLDDLFSFEEKKGDVDLLSLQPALVSNPVSQPNMDFNFDFGSSSQA
jgi:hypothetical protein